MDEKPTAAFVLSLIGGLFYILFSLIFLALGSLLSFCPIAEAILHWVGIVGLGSGAMMIVGSSMIISGEEPKVRNGSILVLVFSIVGIVSPGLVFFVVALVGSILGLTWKPVLPAPSSASM